MGHNRNYQIARYSKAVLYLFGLLSLTTNVACTTTTSRETFNLLDGEEQQFRILGSEVLITVSPQESPSDTVNDREVIGVYLYGKNFRNSLAAIRFNSEECERLLGYSVSQAKIQGTSIAYFDNSILNDAAVTIGIRRSRRNSYTLIISDQEIPLSLLERARFIRITTNSPSTLSLEGVALQN